MPLLEDIDKDTVDFSPNYDESKHEPAVLPARFPNLLVNGAGGIAVGMATNMPPHNLGEVIDGCIAYIDDPAISTEQLIEIIPGPDFPTGAHDPRPLRRAFRLHDRPRLDHHAGANREIEEIRKEREAIIFTEIPYQVNKASLIEKIAELVREKKIEGISDLRDESDRDGMRIVIEIKRDAMADVVLNQLYRYTPLQTSFGANMVALNGGRPELMTLKDLIKAFVDFREEVVSRRTKFLLNKARERAHVLCGLAIAVANIDEVIRLIRTAPDPNAAREALMGRDWPAQDIAPLIALVDDPRHKMNEDGTYRLSEAQARAILDLRLQRLTALGRDEIGDELPKLAAEISDYLEILRSRVRIMAIIKDELVEVRDAFATPRRTEIVGLGSRRRRRGPDPARGHGRHRVACRLHQARAALDLSGPASRRQGPLRHGDPRRGFRHPALRGEHPHAGAVLLVAGPGLQGEGLAPAARGAQRQGQGAGQHAAARKGRAHHHHHAAARGRGHPGTGST